MTGQTKEDQYYDAILMLLRSAIDTSSLERLRPPHIPGSEVNTNADEELRAEVEESTLKNIAEALTALVVDDAEDDVQLARAASAVRSQASTIEQALTTFDVHDPQQVYSVMCLYAGVFARLKAVADREDVTLGSIEERLIGASQALAYHLIALSYNNAHQEVPVPFTLDEALDMSGTLNTGGGDTQVRTQPGQGRETEFFTRSHMPTVENIEAALTFGDIEVKEVRTFPLSQVRPGAFSRSNLPEGLFDAAEAVFSHPNSPLFQLLNQDRRPDRPILFVRLDFDAPQRPTMSPAWADMEVRAVHAASLDLSGIIEDPESLGSEMMRRHFENVVFPTLGKVSLGSSVQEVVFVECILNADAYHLLLIEDSPET